MNLKRDARARKGAVGFTLIELLVVVLIIGILAAIAVPQYFKVVERSRWADAQQTAGAITDAEERYFARNSAYVGTYDPLDVQFMDKTNTAFTGATGSLRSYDIKLALAAPNYTITITRTGTSPARYGAYVITYTCGAGQACLSAPAETTCGTVGACLNDIVQ